MKEKALSVLAAKRGIKPDVRKRRDTRTAYLFLLPSFIGVLFLFVFPYLDVIRRSFFDDTGKSFVWFKNYQKVFSNRSFLLAASNTFWFILVCVPVLILLFLLVAVYLTEKKKFGALVKGIFLFPMAMPVVSVVLFCRVLFAKAGIVSLLVSYFGLSGQNWLNTEYSFTILVLSYIWKNLGYDIILWIAALATIPSDIYEAARLDGAGSVACFCYITMPNLVSSLFLIATLSVINGFKVFREAYLLSGDYPDEHIYLLQHLFNNWFRDLSVSKLSAAAVVMGCILFVFIMIFQKLFDKELS